MSENKLFVIVIVIIDNVPPVHRSSVQTLSKLNEGVKTAMHIYEI